MAEERKDLPARPPLPPLPKLGGGPPLRPPLPTLAPARPAPPAPPAAPEPPAMDLQRKLAETEKRLMEEREKVLHATVRQQEEKVYAAKVEEAIKDVQDRLRRDRREADMEESRLKLETRIQELEQKLVQERETWVSTLKNQLHTRETQDREIETHFSSRMQEMERRWLEEKAHWQKVILAKEEEIRGLKTVSEKLRGADVELEKVASEKQMFERRSNEIAQELASAQGQLKTATEHEREYFSLKAELTLAREQSRMVQDRVEREMQAVRIMAKEREERLMSDNERLQRDIQIVGERVRAEAEVEVRKHKSQADLAGAALQRMRAVGQALERQVATLRSQAEEAGSMKRELQQLNDRYKAEFVVLQRRWQDREKDIRHEIEAAAHKELESMKKEVEAAKLVMARELEAAKEVLRHDVEKVREELEGEKGRLRLRAQEEVQARVQRAEDHIRRQAEESLRGKEAAVRRELEAELEARGARLQDKLKSEIDALRRELVAREAIEKERLLAKEAELLSLKGTLDELRGHLAKEQEWRKSIAGDMERLEREGLGHKDELRRAHEAAEETRGRLAKEEEWKRVLLQEKANLEKLVATLEGELRHKHLAAATLAQAQPPAQAPQAGGGLLGRLFQTPKPPDAPLPPPL